MTLEEREKIFALVNQGKTNRKIAEAVILTLVSLDTDLW